MVLRDVFALIQQYREYCSNYLFKNIHFFSSPLLVLLSYIMDRRDIKYYEARAQTINLEQITSDEYNAEILRLLRDSDPNFTYVYIQNHYEDFCDFVIREGDDLGWLGYFVGQSNSLHSLGIQYLPQDREQVDAFVRGIECNQLIQKLEFYGDIGDGFQSLGSLLKNDNLKFLTFSNFDIGLECARNIAFMLNQPNQRNATTILNFEGVNFPDDAMTEIATALSVHPQLEQLNCFESSIGRNGCVALGNTLGSMRNPNLKQLCLSDNSFDDEGLQVLVAGMRNCHNLAQLVLDGNESIALDGFRSLSTLFQSAHSHMTILQLSSMNIGDEGMRTIAAGLASLQLLEILDLSDNSIGDLGLQTLLEGISHCYNLKELRLSANRSISAVGLRSLSALLQSDSCALDCLSIYLDGDGVAAALANGLKGNIKLKKLIFNTDRLTSVGWSAFLRLLCDTSSVNNTYLSNHTIETIGYWGNLDTPEDVKQLLALNKRTGRPLAAIIKILNSHPDFDIDPLCQWKLKLLPLVMSWFRRVDALAGVYKILEKSEVTIRSRKLSTLYKFIRGMPLLAIIDGSHNNSAMSARSRKRKISQL